MSTGPEPIQPICYEARKTCESLPGGKLAHCVRVIAGFVGLHERATLTVIRVVTNNTTFRLTGVDK